MGLGGISMWQLLIVLAIVIMIFGTKRLKSLGGDLGGALKSFRKAMDDEPKSDETSAKQIGDDAKEDADFVENKDKEKQN